METIVLNAQVRNESKKGPSRRLRARGITPAIFYGTRTKPVMIAVNSSDLKGIVERARKETVFVKLAIDDGDKKTERISILKDLQINTLKKRLDHADFYEVSMDRPLTIDVPVSLVGEPSGVEHGGELIWMKRELKISGLPAELPDTIEVDVSRLEIHDSVRVGEINLKEGIAIVDGEDVVIAHVGMTRAAIAAAAAAAGTVLESDEGVAEEAAPETEGEESTTEE